MYCGLSICPERQKPIIQCCWQGSYENSAWETGFSGCEHLCVSACVCERERERETQGEHTQALRGRQDIDFIRLSKAPRVRMHLSGPSHIYDSYFTCLDT